MKPPPPAPGAPLRIQERSHGPGTYSVMRRASSVPAAVELAEKTR